MSENRQKHMDKTDEINHWLISEARALGDGAAIVNGYAARLVSAGVPLLRANIAQRFANPLLVALGCDLDAGRFQRV